MGHLGNISGSMLVNFIFFLLITLVLESATSCICPAIFAPTCGTDGNTYSNPCEARCNGALVQYLGPCFEKVDPDPLADIRPRTCVQVCPALKSPTCGIDGKTYDNPCLVGCSGTRVAHSGPCMNLNRDKKTPIKFNLPPPYIPRGSCASSCPAHLMGYVCGANGKTYPNICMAGCEGVRVLHKGPCLK